VEADRGSGRIDRQLDLRALFAAFDIPYDEDESREVFARTMARLEARDQRQPDPDE
jgi:predicted nucleic acid-binding protein